VVQRLKQEYQRSVPVYNGGRLSYEPSFSVFTTREFSTRSRMQWLSTVFGAIVAATLAAV
jgi:hypothetical protein